MFEAGKSAEEIARAEGKSTVTIHNWAHKNGLVFNLFRRRYERRREMLEAGASIAEIARAEGVTIQAIYTWIKTK
jgi:transposase-like protein